MQIARDLSRRILETVEQTPLVDIHERLMPESKRVGQRFDFISWLVAYAGLEIQSLGLKSEDLALLGDTNGDPEKRWACLAAYWPAMRSTGTGRAVLRIAWDLFDVEQIDDRSWKDVSARLWAVGEKGYYGDILRERGKVIMTLVDNAVDAGTRGCCMPLYNTDRLLLPGTRADLDALGREFDQPCALVDDLDPLLDKAVRKAASAGCAAFLVRGLPDLDVPSQEEVGWALGRAFRRDEQVEGDRPGRGEHSGRGGGRFARHGVEPALHSYLLHRLLSFIAGGEIPVQVQIRDASAVERLGQLAQQYPEVRFAGVYGGQGSPFALLALARRLPNLVLALGDLWCVAPRLARSTLIDWIQGVPSCKILAFSGDTTMVEAVMAGAQVAREQIAAAIADMVARGSLDEQDAAPVIRRVMFENAQKFFGFTH